jgi:hypothetical protein
MFLAAFLSVAAFGADAASAILIRHDREDAKYRALGDRYAAVGRLGRAGAGTLVAASWVITAAHVAVGMRRDTPFEIGGEAYPIVARVPHPRWTEMGPHDIALVQLERPVTGITSMALYAGRDEEGKDVVFVGFGGTGTGLSGPRSEEDGAKRGATNRVDRATENWIEFTFDAPPGGTDLEGISGPGDSGGPAIIEVSGVPHVAGVSIWGQPGARGRGTYGAREGYTRVSSYVTWIGETLRTPVRNYAKFAESDHGDRHLKVPVPLRGLSPSNAQVPGGRR